MQTTPRVTVVVPMYDGADLIAAAIDTVRRQSFTEFELVVVDDGSTDQSHAVATRIAAAEPRMRVVQLARNQGIAAARNRGVREARGEYVAFLDQDDRWLRDKLAEQVAFLDAHPDVAMVSCFSALVDPSQRILGWLFGARARKDAYRQLLECDVVSGGSVAMIRRACLERIGGFDPAEPVRADWDLWIRIARFERIGTVPRVLVGYTRSSQNMSSDYEAMAQAGRRVLDRAFSADPALSPRFRRQCLARDSFAIACFCLINRDARRAWRYLARSIAVTPWPILKSPRRWMFVGALVLATILPARAFALLFGLGARRFGLRPGAPLQSLEDAPTGETDARSPSNARR